MSGNNNNSSSSPFWSRPASNRIGRIGEWGDSSASSSRGSSSGPRFATLGDTGGEPAMARPPRDEDEDDEDEDEDERKEGETWYAGGERSGVSIQGPSARGPDVPGGNLVRDLLRRAVEGGMAAQQAETAREPRSLAFSGGGHTLGGDEVESQYIPDPSAPQQTEETAIRYLTLWRNGFQIGDGELMRYDDPAHAEILKLINSGRAPPALLGVDVGQEVELRVNRHTEEDFAPPRYKAFAGEGHRLGSPVPGEHVPVVGGSSSASMMPGTFPVSGTIIATAPAATTERESLTTRFAVDQTQPTTSLQVRLADGTRLVCRMNHTHTVGDVRNFINASRPENTTRAYNIMTTFPSRVLEDDKQTIKDAGLINSVVVQRWV